MGCKQQFANEMINAMPRARHFYDLFGGGGSVSEAAFDSGMYEKVHYNELNHAVYLLNKELWAGVFNFAKAEGLFVGREEFRRVKGEMTAWGAFVRFVWSFGSDGDTYLYGKDVEKAKEIIHALINSDFLPNAAPAQKLSYLKSLIDLNDLERSAVIERVERMRECSGKYDIIASCSDYSMVGIENDSVLYCDIPYETKKSDSYYGIDFDFGRFYDWAANNTFPVYFSGFLCSDARFEPVWKKERKNAFTKKGGLGVKRTEVLFWNKVEKEPY